jgi:cytochrome c
MAVLALLFSQVFADDDIEKGKKLFDDVTLGGGTSGKSCNSCHPNGKGLEGIGSKTEFRAMGKTYKSLEDVTNYFIETAQKGKALAPCSDEMKALVAYLKSLKPAK